MLAVIKHPMSTKIIWSMWWLDTCTEVCLSSWSWVILDLFSSHAAMLHNTSDENKMGPSASPSFQMLACALFMLSFTFGQISSFPQMCYSWTASANSLHQPALIQGWQPTNSNSIEDITVTWSQFIELLRSSTGARTVFSGVLFS